MRKIWNYGGLIAATILIAFGITSIVMGVNGRDTVRSNLDKELIVGSPDMTPQAIAKEAKAAGLKDVALPTKSVAGQSIDTGAEARTFAEYMRIHALEATQGKTYAQMPRFATEDGAGSTPTSSAVSSTVRSAEDFPKY